ncbi:MAG TPA: 50S ribosomal protein L4 [Candidatus Paceibacterota bacterium]
MKVTVYNQKGKEVDTVDAPENVFGLPWNGDLVHQIMVALQASLRTPIAHTKDRSEVSGGGKKPWRQKGTGRARHGSRRSPLWRHGGATFGPRNERTYKQKINKKMGMKALFVVLSKKMKQGEIAFIDGLDVGSGKTRDAKVVLENMQAIPGFTSYMKKKKNGVGIFLARPDKTLSRSFKNFGNVDVAELRNINVLDALKYKRVVFTDPKATISFLEKKTSKAKDVSLKNEAVTA